MNLKRWLTCIVLGTLIGLVAPHVPRADALYSCTKSAIHRDTSSSGYVSGSTVCTSGTGGQQSVLQVMVNGAVITDYGPCVGKFSGSPAYVYVPWYLGGPRRATVIAYGWKAC